VSYAIVWQEAGDDVFAGELELGDAALRLEGVSRGGRSCRRVLDYGELSVVRGARGRERLDGRPTLVIEHPGGPALKLGSVGGGGVLSEVADRLARGALDA
jgi:hypothetical protein